MLLGLQDLQDGYLIKTYKSDVPPLITPLIKFVPIPQNPQPSYYVHVRYDGPPPEKRHSTDFFREEKERIEREERYAREAKEKEYMLSKFLVEVRQNVAEVPEPQLLQYRFYPADPKGY